jgi:hypothetical protein
VVAYDPCEKGNPCTPLLDGANRGTRPRFKLVTGISAGALIAPFAYLGSKYDYVQMPVIDDEQHTCLIGCRSRLPPSGCSVVVLILVNPRDPTPIGN